MSTRYGSITPSSSTELKAKTKTHSSSLKHLIGGGGSKSASNPPQSRALAETKKEQSLSGMMKKLMEKKPKGSGGLVVAADCLAEDLKRHGKKGSNFSGLHKKLFSSGKGENVKALTEVKSNTRSLGMVLRSERELLSQNKDLDLEIADLKLTIEERNREVEKLKDLCLKQREEIKALKTAILFPDVLSSQLQELLEKQGSELKQAKQLIPSLQRQVTSLTGQLQFLAEDLEEVKADKYSVRGCYDDVSSPRTPIKYQEEAANSLEFSSPGQPIPGSPDDMLLKDLNPCLTPYYATKSKEFELKGYNSLHDDRLCEISKQTSDDLESNDQSRMLSKSSDCRRCSNSRNTSFQGTRRSDEIKFKYGKQQMQHKLF